MEREPVVEPLARRGTRSCSPPPARYRDAAAPRTCRTTSRTWPCRSPVGSIVIGGGPTNCGVFAPASARRLAAARDARRRIHDRRDRPRPGAGLARGLRRRRAVGRVARLRRGVVVTGEDQVPDDEQRQPDHAPHHAQRDVAAALGRVPLGLAARRQLRELLVPGAIRHTAAEVTRRASRGPSRRGCRSRSRACVDAEPPHRLHQDHRARHDHVATARRHDGQRCSLGVGHRRETGEHLLRPREREPRAVDAVGVVAVEPERERLQRGRRARDGDERARIARPAPTWPPRRARPATSARSASSSAAAGGS